MRLHHLLRSLLLCAATLTAAHAQTATNAPQPGGEQFKGIVSRRRASVMLYER